VWAGVVAVNRVAISLYLWHMVAALAASLVFWATGLVTAAPPLSATWWWQRPLWYLVCTALLLVIVRGVRRFEWVVAIQRPVPDSPSRLALMAGGVLGLAAGMVQLTMSGLAGGPTGLPAVGLAVFVAGALAVRAATGITGTVPAAANRAAASVPPPP
jgi:hypothetical protein